MIAQTPALPDRGAHFFRKGGFYMNQKKNDSFLLGSILAGVVSALCLQGMKLVGKKIEEHEKKKP